MKKFLIIMAAVVSTSFFVGCDTDDEFTAPNYATFETGSDAIKIALGGTTSYDIIVYTANVVSNDRNLDIVVRDGSTLSEQAYSVPGSVTIPGGTNEGVITIDIEDINFSPNGEDLILGLASTEGLYVGNDFNLNVSWSCDNPLVVDFVFDGYASETTWDVTDAEGNILLSGGGFSDGTEAATVERCLPDGDYTFTVYDAFGDGLTYPEEGSVSLSYSDVELVQIPGDFGEEVSVDFTLGENASAGDLYVNVDEDEDTDDSDEDDSDEDDSEGDDSEGDDSEGDDSEGDDSEGDDSDE